MNIDFTRLHRAFYPKSIVVVGDKDRFSWLNGQKNFTGNLSSVQISPQSIQAIEAMGVTNYTSLLDVPGPIDLVIVSVPRSASLKVLEDCITRDVGAVHFFTAGFTETDTEEGVALEQQLIARCRQAGLHLIGPNCMGVYNPLFGVCQSPGQATGFSGVMGFISQSGTHAGSVATEARIRGVNVSLSVSYGNGVVIDSTDYLEYFNSIPEIKIIGMYIEGVRDGRRFLEVLRRVAREKPVVIWKGGRTEEGARAIGSHTASMAISHRIWDTAVRQCGAVAVRDLDEFMDAVQAFHYLPQVSGKRVGVTGGSGGESVAIADAFGEAGLVLPRLTDASYHELASFFSLIGGHYLNPIDTGNVNQMELVRIIRILDEDANVDTIAVLLRPSARSGWMTRRMAAKLIRNVIEAKQRCQKPMIVIIPFSKSTEMEEAREMAETLREAGIPTFDTSVRAARALRILTEYYPRRLGAEASD